jgi:hypothetical protein
LVRVPVRERPQQYRIHDAENRAVRADAQRQRGHSHESEAGISPQRPQAIPQILKEYLDESDSTHLAIYLLRQCDVSELPAGGPSRLVLTHPLADIPLGEQTQVRLDLVVEISFRSAASE